MVRTSALKIATTNRMVWKWFFFFLDKCRRVWIYETRTAWEELWRVEGKASKPNWIDRPALFFYNAMSRWRCQSAHQSFITGKGRSWRLWWGHRLTYQSREQIRSFATSAIDVRATWSLRHSLTRERKRIKRPYRAIWRQSATRRVDWSIVKGITEMDTMEWKIRTRSQTSTIIRRAIQYLQSTNTVVHWLSDEFLELGKMFRDFVRDHNNVAAVSYTHLTLPTNREV